MKESSIITGKNPSPENESSAAGSHKAHRQIRSELFKNTENISKTPGSVCPYFCKRLEGYGLPFKPNPAAGGGL